MRMTDEIKKAVAILHQGGIVAFPTETVYGLGADASNEAAIRRIFQAKSRPYDHPLIVHIATLNQLSDWAIEVSPQAMQLAQAFWPGPLTIILKKQRGVLDLVTGGQATIGLRMPRHPVAQQLLQAFSGGLAAPSANKFTHISPTTAAAVAEELGSQVDLILEGGMCEVGLESTIIDMSGDQPIILRPGMITVEMIAQTLQLPVASAQQEKVSQRAPGMHHLHYAPTTQTTLMGTQALIDYANSVQAKDLPMVFMVHSDLVLPMSGKLVRVNMPNRATDYAHDLYSTLRSLDHQQYQRIIIEDVPYDPEWTAIRDRLSKASGHK